MHNHCDNPTGCSICYNFEDWADEQGPLDELDIYATMGEGPVAVWVADKEDPGLYAEILYKDGTIG